MKYIILAAVLLSSQAFAWENHHWESFDELAGNTKPQQPVDPYQQQLDAQRAMIEADTRQQLQHQKAIMEMEMRQQMQQQQIMNGYR